MQNSSPHVLTTSDAYGSLKRPERQALVALRHVDRLSGSKDGLAIGRHERAAARLDKILVRRREDVVNGEAARAVVDRVRDLPILLASLVLGLVDAVPV